MQIPMQGSRKELTAALQSRKECDRTIDDAKVQYAAIRAGLDKPMQKMIDRHQSVGREITQLHKSLPKTRGEIVRRVALPILLGIVSLGLAGLSIVGLRSAIDSANLLIHAKGGGDYGHIGPSIMAGICFPFIMGTGAYCAIGIIWGIFVAAVCAWKVAKVAMEWVQLKRLQNEEIQLQCTIAANPTAQNCLKASRHLSSLYPMRNELTQRMSTALQTIHAEEQRMIV